LNRKSIYHITLTAVLAALTTAMILVFFIPVGEGRMHFGDAIILLAAVLLPTPYAMAVGAIGGGMANLLGGAVLWAPATVIIKAAITMSFSAKQDKLITKRNVFSLFPYAAITIIGYALYQLLLITFGVGQFAGLVWTVIFANVLSDLVQIAGSSVLFILLATLLEKIKFKQRLGLS